MATKRPDHAALDAALAEARRPQPITVQFTMGEASALNHALDRVPDELKTPELSWAGARIFAAWKAEAERRSKDL